jgi:cation diffusion facilitator family transporter
VGGRFEAGLRPDRRPRLTSEVVAAGSLAIDCGLVLAKLVLGITTGSLGLLSDAAHSGLDLVASGFTLVAIRAARKPADSNHPYGHGRAENLAAFGQGILLVVAAAAIAYEGSQRLLGGRSSVDPAWYAIGFLAGTMALELGRAVVLRMAARAWASPALAASAQNRFADFLAAGGVLAGLIGVRLGFSWADPAAALVVAAVIARAAGLLVKRSADVLVDRSPTGVEEELRRTIGSVDGVRGVRSVRVRGSGSRILGDARVTARPSLSVEGAQQLSERVQAAVGAIHPNLELALVVESGSDAASLVERVHAVAARQGTVRDLHNVTVEHEMDGSLHVSMHAKLPGAMSLRDAAAASADLERDLHERLPGVSRVDVHLEPLEPELVRGSDVTPLRVDLARTVRQVVGLHPEVLACRDVELSSRENGVVAHVVAAIPGDVSLDHAHQVETELEERLRTAIPELAEVVVRATP